MLELRISGLNFVQKQNFFLNVVIIFKLNSSVVAEAETLDILGFILFLDQPRSNSSAHSLGSAFQTYSGFYCFHVSPLLSSKIKQELPPPQYSLSTLRALPLFPMHTV